MGKLLEKFKGRFVGDVIGNNGCETCGYGADFGMSEEEFNLLLIEMDEWAERLIARQDQGTEAKS